MKFISIVQMVVLIICLNQAWGNEGALKLENPRIAVEIDPQSGAIRSIRDKEQDVVYPQSGIGFEVVAARGVLRSRKASADRSKLDLVELSYAGSGLDVTLHYRLGAKDHFVEKWVEIKSSDAKPYFLKSVVLENMATKAFSEIHFHDDKTI